MGFIRYYRFGLPESCHMKHCAGQSHASRKHTHDELAVALVTGGHSLFRFIREEVRISEGQLVVIGPEVVHQCCPEQVEGWSFYMVYLTRQWLEEAGFSSAIVPGFSSRDLEAPEFGQLLRQFEALTHRAADKEEPLMAIAAAALLPPEDPNQALPEDAPSDRLMEQVGAYIKAHLSETLRIDDLASRFGLNKYTLIRQFGKHFNAPPHAWQNMQRMNAARHLLDEGASIADAAAAVGFYDQSHFTKAFKESFGVTPLQISG